MRIPKPFLPVCVESENLCHTVHVIGRDYIFGPDGLPTSIRSQGQELLASPVRVICTEDGGDALWDDNYPENESESFIQSRSDKEAVICGAKQSERFILDCCTTVRYDGSMEIDLKLMTRGKTVAQEFGIADIRPVLFRLDRLWLEIPLKGEAASLFHRFPNCAMKLSDGSVQPMTQTSMSGRIPDEDVGLPFRPLLWLGNEDRGLGWFAENDRNWQPADPGRAMELVRKDGALTLRIRLLDSHPVSWKKDPAQGMGYFPVDFHFGLMATPVKPFPANPYIHNAFHLDCGIKIKGNYKDYMSDQGRFDRLVEKGVTTLILHEKWNKSQNWFELSEYTAAQLSYLVEECHKRGIRVLPYFGYEMSAMSPVWSGLHEKALLRNRDGSHAGGWWRVPFQRDYVVCYQSEYQELFLKGIEKLMDTYHIDGVYLDGTHEPRLCFNTDHGCGFRDENGTLHGTWPVGAVRRMFERLYEIVQSRGGMINVHGFGMINFTALPYIHQTWYGENLQFTLMKGSTADLDLDYFRAEYTGRNMGVPVEFIVYENRPLWKFESALSSCLIHGILPRPNDIEHPLELMGEVWDILGRFPIAQSEWLPYWENQVRVSSEKVKVSYYRYRTLTGEPQLLVFAANISSTPIEGVTVTFKEPVSSAFDAQRDEETGFTFGLDAYGYRILYVR